MIAADLIEECPPQHREDLRAQLNTPAKHQLSTARSHRRREVAALALALGDGELD